MLILQTLVVFCCSAQNAADHIIERYRKYLWITAPQPAERTKMLTAAVKAFELNMDDKDRGRALVLLHNIRELAIAWSDPSNGHDPDSVRTTLETPLQRCLAYLLKDPEWVLSQMDVASDVRDITLLLQHHLTPDQRQQCLGILKRHRLQGKASGVGTILINELGIHYNALVNDTLQLARCRDLIVNEVRISEADGIQADHSFHQKGKRLDMFRAGRTFLLDQIRIAWQLQGTPWAYPDEKTSLLTDVITEGWQWMARSVHTVPGVLGDYATTENALRNADLRPIIPFLKELAPGKLNELLAFERWQNGEDVSISVRYWPYSDLTAYHQGDFSFFIKTISNRTLPSFVSDDANRRGHLFYSGDTYLMHDGMEYFNLMPVWNWQRLPGVTSFDKARIIERPQLAGNVNNGKSSATAMDLMLKDSLQTQHLSARKFWAVHNGVMVCLVGGMAGRFAGNAVTTLDQCRRRGDVTVNKPGNILKPGVHKLNNVSWIHHAGFVYITFPFLTYKVPMYVGLESRNGNWQSINRQQPDKSVTDNVFHLSIDHGHLLEGETTGDGYIVARAETPQAAQAIASKPEWGILRDYADAQVVHFKDGTIMAAFYKPHMLGSSVVNLEVSGPCLLLIENRKLYVASIDGKGRSVRVKWNNLVFKVTPPANGATVEAQAIDEE